jgi:hypothetical protein
LRLFAKDAAELLGVDRIVWLDLDVLIVGNIDHILNDQEDLKIWKVDGEISKCNGSLVSHKLGARTALWEKFNPRVIHPTEGFIPITGNIGSDQAWIAQNLGPRDYFFGQVDGIYSWRCHILKKPLPPNACMVFFHGVQQGKPDELWGIPWIRRTLESLQQPRDQNFSARASTRNVPKEKLRVVVWKWRPRAGLKSQYNAECVNTMLSMVDRNYKAAYEMVCITDDATGIDGAVRIVPLWKDLEGMDHPVPDNVASPICYRRLKMFAPEMADILAPRFVSVDLDAVITGDLRPLWGRKEEFVGWDRGLPWSPYCGAMILHTAGTRPHIWTGFNPKTTPLEAAQAGFVGTDQAAIAYALRDRKEAVWTETEGVYAFQRLGRLEDRQRRLIRRSRARPPRESEQRAQLRTQQKYIERHSLPPNCAIVFFNGIAKPWHKQVQEGYKFVPKLYRQENRPND